MNTSEITHQPGPITVSVTVDHATADLLWQTASPNFLADQPDRFERLGVWQPTAPASDLPQGGTLFWCQTASDALLLRAYEQACGRDTTLLWDIACAELSAPGEYLQEAAYVVHSSRRYGC